MKAKVLGLLTVGLVAGPMAVSADVIIADFTTRNGIPSASGGQVVFSLNPDGTIAATLSSFGSNIRGFGFDSVTYRLPQSGFAPTAPTNTGDWITEYGDFASGFLCESCGALESWTIGNAGDFSSVLQALGGGRATPYDFFLQTADFNQWTASVSPAPEPGTLALLGLGLAGLGLGRRRTPH